MEKLNSCNHLNFGRVLCQTGQFARGAEQFEKAIKADPENALSWAHAAAVRLQAEDATAFRDTCRKMLDQFADTDDPWDASEAAVVCLLGPNDFAEGSVPFKLAEVAIKHGTDPANNGQFVMAKALADVRANRYDKASKDLQALIDKATVAVQQSISRYLLVQTLWHTAKADEARRQLAEADKFCEAHPISDHAGSWYQRILVDMARRETRQLVAERNESSSSESATSPPLGEN
jgi:tetratricopeptide (TPR) repeat protein